MAERDGPVERRQLPGDRAQQRGLAGAVRADDPDPLAALGGEERGAGHHGRLGRGPAVDVVRAAPRQIADHGLLDADDDLARAARGIARERLARQREPASGPRRGALLRLQLLEPRLVLVHLRELAVAAVALHELAFARDLLGVRVGFLRRALVALRALAVVGGVVAAERGQLPVAQLPDARHGRVEECPVVRCHEQRARPALEVHLEPLERVDVEVVRRLVEQEQVGVGDHEAGQRGPRLLAAGHRRRRLRPLAAREAEPRQRRIDAQVQRVPAQRIEAVLELGVGRLRRRGRHAPGPRARRPSRRDARRPSGRRCAGPEPP